MAPLGVRRALRLDAVSREPGSEWAIQPYITFKPSEFLRFRVGYKHTERTHRLTGPDDRGSARIVDEILFQASFILGAHPTDLF